MTIGDKVKIIDHTHPDVIPGITGVITDKIESGFGVKISGSWVVAGSDRGETRHETRVVFFMPKSLQEISLL